MSSARRALQILPHVVLLFLACMATDQPRGQALGIATTGSFGVGLSVDARCTMIVTAVSFGSYTSGNPSAVDADGNVTLDCDNSIANFVMNLRLSQGMFPAPGSTAANPLRRMSNGGSGRMRYGLYRDASRTQTWGDTVATAYFPGAGPFPVNIPVYGRIPASQTVLPGVYNDVVTVTLYY